MSLFKRKSQSFADIIKGLQYAVNTAQEMLTFQHLNQLGRYFDPEGNAYTQTIRTSDGQGIEVPLVTLVPHNSLIIDQIEIKFTAKVEDLAQAAPMELHLSNDILQESGAGPLQFDMNMTAMPQKKGMMDVTIRFKTTDAPEGFSRVVAEQTKYL